MLPRHPLAVAGYPPPRQPDSRAGENHRVVDDRVLARSKRHGHELRERRVDAAARRPTAVPVPSRGAVWYSRRMIGSNQHGAPAALPPRTLVVHIGTPKTGSATIQRMLAALDPDLRTRGIRVPVTGRVNGRHVGLLRAAGVAGTRVPGMVRDFAAACGLTVRIVAYVRPQCQYLESRYAYAVRTGAERRPFDVYVAGTFFRRPVSRHAWLNYRRVFAPWRAVFGAGVLVTPLETTRPPEGLVAHFLKLLGAGDLAGTAGPRANTRPGAKELEVRRLVACALPGTGARRRRQLMRRLDDLGALLAPDPPFAGLGAGEAEELMRCFTRDNDAFAREYGIAHDGVLFREAPAGGVNRPCIGRWHDLDAATQTAVREYVRRRVGVEPAPPDGPATGPPTPARFGSLRWRAGRLRDPRFRAWLFAEPAARFARAARGKGR